MLIEYLSHITVYFVSFFSILSIFLPRRGYSLNDVPRAFLFSVLSIIAISGLNYFRIHNNYLSFIILTLVGLPTLKNVLKISLSRDDRQVLLGIGIYGLIFLAYFATFATFLAGDIITHASFIHAILEGEPIRVPLINSHILDYPKGYHFLTAFFAGVVGIINAIKLTSVIAITFTLLFIYLIAERLGVYAKGAVLIAAIFVPHYFYILWGGYTSQIAMMFALLVILFSLKNELKLTLLSIILIFMMHPRAFFFIMPFSLAYIFFQKNSKSCKVIFLLVFILVSLSVLQEYSYGRPKFWSTLKDATLKFHTDWYLRLLIVFLPSLLVIPSLIWRWNTKIICWLIILIPFIYLLDHSYGARRVIESNYVFFSLAGASILNSRYKSLLVSSLVLYALLLMPYELYSYRSTFTISSTEFNEFQHATQNISSSFIINLDQICEWFYPLENVRVSHPYAQRYVDYNEELYNKTEELLSGKPINVSYDMCISRYSLAGEKTPFIQFEKVPIPDATIVYNGSLIRIMHMDPAGE